MRISAWTIVTALICTVASSACDRAPQAPLAPESASLDATNPTANGNGAMIMRFQRIAFLFMFDAEHHLLSADVPSNFCATPAFSMNDLQQITTPSEIEQFLSKVSGDEHMAVYHADSPADAGFSSSLGTFGGGSIVDGATFCAFLAGPNRIAEGTVQRISTLSNASFHVRWAGMLPGVDGSDYHLTAVYQLNGDAHDPSNPDAFTEPVVDIHLTPVGR